MHKEILTTEQIGLLPLVHSFSKDFGLVGGTAVALHLGHRRSIDFDLFTHKEFGNAALRRKIVKFKKIERIVRDERGQYTLMINGVRFTFFHYPYPIGFSKKFENIIKMADLLTLAAMKAHALGRRAKWKDYVDLYFIMKCPHTLAEIAEKSKHIFGKEFNEKLLRTQLAYFKDIDRSEEVIYMEDREVSDDVIEKELIEFSLS